MAQPEGKAMSIEQIMIAATMGATNRKKHAWIRVKPATDAAILEEYKKKNPSREYYEAIEWSTHMQTFKVIPPSETAAIVVDVVDDKGAFRVYRNDNDRYVGGVGKEDMGFRVIVPWDESWWFRITGRLTVGYIKVKTS